jgi:hypothetical protein
LTFDPAAPGRPTPTTIATSQLYAVACPSITQCTAVDNAGEEVTFDPRSRGRSAPSVIDHGHLLFSVACPKTHQCTVVDNSGRELTFDPKAPHVARPKAVDGRRSLDVVACPSAVQCTAVEEFGSGGEVTFDPAVPSHRMRVIADRGQYVFGLACPTVSDCVTLSWKWNESSRSYSTDAVEGNPRQSRRWTVEPMPGASPLITVACSSVTQCVAADDQGDVYVGTPATKRTRPGAPGRSVRPASRGLIVRGVGPITSVAGFSFPPLSPPPFAEIPPWVIYQDGVYRYFITTDRTYECTAPDSLLTGIVSCARDRTRLVTEAEADRFSNPRLIPAGTAYKRTYEGVFSAQLLGQTLVAIDHGENGNEIRQEQIDGRTRNVHYHNTIQPHHTSCWGGVRRGVYRNCDRDYYAFIDSSTAPASPETAPWHDHGPILWPRNGYLTQRGGQASWGLRHPYSITAGGYFYVFYLDTGRARQDPSGLPTQGLGAGIAVARSPIKDDSRPGTFKTWDGRHGWLPALPHGFSIRAERRYFHNPGGASIPLLGTGRGSYYFAVARVDGPSHWRYFGLEHYSVAHARSCHGHTSLQDALWESNDLIHWHHRTRIPQLTSCGANQHVAYDNSQLHFPHFFNAAATSQDAIDPANFYLIGTSATGITLVRMSTRP